MLRPDILFCLIMLIAVIVYAFRHPDIDYWRRHYVSTDTIKRAIDTSLASNTIALRRGYT